MERRVAFRTMDVVGGYPVTGDDDTAWEQRRFAFLEGVAEGDDDRPCAWEVMTRGHLVALGEPDDEPVTVEPFDFLGVAGAGLVRFDEYAILVVDGADFGYDLLDRMQYAPPAVQAQVFASLTEAEQAWLDELDRVQDERQVRLALAALEAAYGPAFRIESKDALAAARCLADAGYVVSLEPLFGAHRSRFSNTARQVMRCSHEEHQPDR